MREEGFIIGGIVLCLFVFWYCLREGVERARERKRVAGVRESDSTAQYELALAFANGRGVRRNFSKAVKHLRIAAELRHVEATYTLAAHLQAGLGVKKDTEAAVALYMRAAEAGHRDSQFNLGLCYEVGDGVPRDLSRAIKWYERATALGDEQARVAVAELKHALAS